MAETRHSKAESVRARLLAMARARELDFQPLLTRFVLERLLWRLGETPYRDSFALKGAMLLTGLFPDPHRPTRDLDFLGFGAPSAERLLQVFREICAHAGDDAVIYDVESLAVAPIREDTAYGGLRIRTRAMLGTARIAVVVDVGFGDATEPGLQDLSYPALLEFPPPRLRAYAPETVIAEKFEAICALGLGNTRLKDFYDIWMLSRSMVFDPDRLSRAVAATFARRGTPLPEDMPDGLSDVFATDPARQNQWRRFREDLAVDPGELTAVVAVLRDFLMPVAVAARL